ncbi:hypothetical protein AAVH_13601 [Aphelenchoides avenae]|nr:hypothetical protein AAVH_13601 [Aphelenchus avenae]
MFLLQLLLAFQDVVAVADNPETIARALVTWDMRIWQWNAWADIRHSSEWLAGVNATRTWMAEDGHASLEFMPGCKAAEGYWHNDATLPTCSAWYRFLVGELRLREAPDFSIRTLEQCLFVLSGSIFLVFISGNVRDAYFNFYFKCLKKNTRVTVIRNLFDLFQVPEWTEKLTTNVRQLADEQNSITDEQSSSSSASKLNGRAASPTEEDEEPLLKRPNTGLRPLIDDVSVSYDKDVGKFVETHARTLGEPSQPTAQGHVLAAKVKVTFSKEVQEAMQKADEERCPALKTAPRYSPNLYDANLRYSTEKKVYTVQVFPPMKRRDNERKDDGDNGGQGLAANMREQHPQRVPAELETPEAEEAVNFLLNIMKHPNLFDFHCVRGKDVVAALQRRGDKKLTVEHALGIEYYEGIEATSPQALIECMDQVESVLLRNMPGTQATLIKQYLDNSLLKLCLSKNIPRIWMPTVSCPQVTEDVIIDFCFGGDSVSHVFQERKLHIYGPGVTPKFFEKLVEASTSSDRAQILELRAWRVNFDHQLTQKYASRKKTLRYSNEESECGWYYDFTDNATPFQIAFNPERNQRCITLRRGPKEMVGKDWFYGAGSSALKPLAFYSSSIH